jgi:hypothetical protein
MKELEAYYKINVEALPQDLSVLELI